MFIAELWTILCVLAFAVAKNNPKFQWLTKYVLLIFHTGFGSLETRLGAASLVWGQFVLILCIFSFWDTVSVGRHCLGQKLKADRTRPHKHIYSFCLDVACVTPTHIPLAKTSHEAKPQVSTVGSLLWLEKSKARERMITWLRIMYLHSMVQHLVSLKVNNCLPFLVLYFLSLLCFSH